MFPRIQKCFIVWVDPYPLDYVCHFWIIHEQLMYVMKYCCMLTSHFPCLQLQSNFSIGEAREFWCSIVSFNPCFSWQFLFRCGSWVLFRPSKQSTFFMTGFFSYSGVRCSLGFCSWYDLKGSKILLITRMYYFDVVKVMRCCQIQEPGPFLLYAAF